VRRREKRGCALQCRGDSSSGAHVPARPYVHEQVLGALGVPRRRLAHDVNPPERSPCGQNCASQIGSAGTDSFVYRYRSKSLLLPFKLIGVKKILAPWEFAHTPVVFIHCPYSIPHPPQMGRVWVENKDPFVTAS
jgi:hypothetical protein